MGVKKLALFVLLVVSVCAQDTIVEDKGISDNVIETEPRTDDIDVKEVDAVTTETGSPVEVLLGAEELEVKSGKYQLNDGLVGDETVNLEAVESDISSNNNVQSGKQLYMPLTTMTTNNEYGKQPYSIRKRLFPYDI